MECNISGTLVPMPCSHATCRPGNPIPPVRSGNLYRHRTASPAARKRSALMRPHAPLPPCRCAWLGCACSGTRAGPPLYVGKEARVGPKAQGCVRSAAAARPTRVGPRARAFLPTGFCQSEGRTGDVPGMICEGLMAVGYGFRRTKADCDEAASSQ